MQDAVHHGMWLPPVAYAFMNTREMKVLKDKRQLGNCHHLYASATHDRFQHCCGVAWLSRRLIQSIASAQPTLGITPRLVTMVTLAGLAHDLGHGPFSHLYETKIAHSEPGEDPFCHETMSEVLLRRVLKYPHVQAAMRREFGDDADRAPDIICGLIHGRNRGLEPKFGFATSIVSDPSAGLDMDRLDYIMRDTMMCGLKVEFTIEEIITTARVVDGVISWPIKMANNLDSFYRTRFRLFRDACRHRTVIAADWVVANVSTWLVKYGPKGYTAPRAHLDADSFVELDDTILKNEAYAGNTEAIEALRRLNERDLPVLVTQFEPENDIDYADLHKAMVNIGFVERLNNHYGSKTVDPLTQLRFFDHTGAIVTPKQSTGVRPSKFHEIRYMVFAVDKTTVHAVQDAIRTFERKHDVSCAPTHRIKHWYSGYDASE